jgi:hypothetical protein
MMRAQLTPHPATPMPQVHAFEVALSRSDDGGLALRFDCQCDADALRLPGAQPAAAADELWRHTCCELFVGVAGDAAYREFNWSPSGQWAAYRFAGYRERDPAPACAAVPVPFIEFASAAESWSLEVSLEVAALPKAAAEQIEFGLAAVLEATDGTLSYWALRHAAARPDFHRRESFMLRLSELTRELEA